MQRHFFKLIAISAFALVVIIGTVRPAQSRDSKTPYPNMAPLEQYLMERTAEIALARSAAPESISGDAEVMILGRRSYEIAAKGTNGFVCMVLRSWTAGTDEPEFWNPKLRAPHCFNPAAARSYLPIILKKTDLVLAGRSKVQMADAINAAFEKKELPEQESGAMCYMMSKQGYLNDRAGHWRPHVMFFAALTEPAAWGADRSGSPILSAKDTLDRLTIFMVPVAHWSDGTADSENVH